MHDAGCVQLLIGLESPLQDSLDNIEIKSNWKMKQWKVYKRDIHTIQSHGISVNGCFVLGLDRQGEGIFNSVFEFVDDTRLHEVQITIQTAFPGTPLYERLEADGRIIEDKAWHKLTLFDINFTPLDMTVDQLRNGFYDLADKIYSDEFTQLRRSRFRRQIRTTHKDEKRKPI